MENSINELYNEDDLKLTPKLPENKNNKYGKSPLMMPTLSKVIKRKVNNNILQKSQKIGKDREREQLYLDYHRNSINNINNLRANLPNIITSLTPNERRNNNKRTSMGQKNKSSQGNKTTYISRNFDLSMLGYNNSDNPNFFENEKLNSTFNFNKNKNNKYNDNDMNLSQILFKKNKNNIYLGNNNIYSRNIENNSNKRNSNYITQNNLNTNNYNRLKFSLNKKNLMHTIKKPSKINLEKKNLKYKIPLDMINNYNYGKKKILNDIIEENHGNNRKLHIKQRNNKSLNKDKNIEEQSEKEEMNINDSKSFIESTLIAFNGLVSQAQELGQILLDNKEMINSKNKNQLNNNLKASNIDDNNEINDINVKSKLNKLNQEIKNEHKTVEELQKINSDLNNKINLFNENTQQYENKVKELVTVINQIKNSNTASNSNSNSDNLSNGVGNNNNNIVKKEGDNFMLENKPKKKKMKFGFVETIFMKDDKFEVILKKKPPKYDISDTKILTINKTRKEPKLVFVNSNKDEDNKKNEKIKDKASDEQYLDAASQIANNLIIESLLLLEKEDEDD
jgi:hypothetical protein